MKKQLFIILSIFLFTANANAASEYNNVLHEKNNIEFGLQSSVYSNNGILDGSTELSRIGRAIVHMGHEKFLTHPATQNAITALSWIAPIGKGVTLISNIIRIGAKLITKQAVKEGLKSFTKSNFRTNLGKLTGKTPANSQAHHVFPQRYATDFSRAGINIHDPKFGVWWETSSHLKNASGYNAVWESFLITNPTQPQILNKGRQLMQQYGIPVNF